MISFKSRNLLWTLLLVTAALGAALWRFGGDTVEPTLAAVSPARGALIKKSTVTGTIAPRRIVKIKSVVNGVVAQLYAEPGQKVRKGDMLARLRVLPDPTEVSEVRSRLEKARLEYERATAYLARREVLREQQVIAENDFQDDLLKFNLTQEAYRSAERDVALKVKGVSDNPHHSPTRVEATIDGVVLERLTGTGDFVIKASEYSEGTTLTTLADIDQLLFKGEVDEADAGRLTPGMTLQVTIGALPEHPFEGVLEFVAPVATRSESGRMTYAIHAALKNRPDAVVRAGYSASAEIVHARRDNVLTIPESYVQFEHNEPYVTALGAAGTEMRRIVTGVSDGLRVEVISGLSERDRIAPPPKHAVASP